MAKASRKFLELLAKSEQRERFDDLVAQHTILQREFHSFARAAQSCGLQLSIYNPQLSEAVRKLVGGKEEKLEFWAMVFEASSRQIKGSRVLPKLNLSLFATERGYSRALFDTVPITQSEGSISLDDAAAIREAVEAGFLLISELESSAVELSEFIKANCEFADLFADDATA